MKPERYTQARCRRVWRPEKKFCFYPKSEEKLLKSLMQGGSSIRFVFEKTAFSARIVMGLQEELDPICGVKDGGRVVNRRKGVRSGFWEAGWLGCYFPGPSER